LKIIKLLINSNIYISFAAVSLTLATQVQLGLNIQWHPYLFLIFFATLFEYNLHRLITLLTRSDTILSDKYIWVKKNIKWFYLLVLFSVFGFFIAVLEAKMIVLCALLPIAGLTLFYSTPLSRTTQVIFRLRQIPYLKIFIISFVWSTVSIILPIMQAEKQFNNFHIFTMIAERFLFVFAITIPFDIRDMDADRSSALKTIPLLLGEQKSIQLSLTLLHLFFITTVIHYTITSQWILIAAYTISFLSTYFFICNKKLHPLPLYYYGILDGTLLLQGALVIAIQSIYLIY